MKATINDNYLFVYGLLRRCAPHPMARYLASESKFISRGYIRGALYLVEDYPGVVPDKDQGQVLGEIYKIENEQLWKLLDDFEGIDHSNEYRRETVVAVVDKIPLKCQVYKFCGSTEALERIWSGDFLGYLREHPGLLK